MTESGGLPEVQFESTVSPFRGSPLTVTEGHHSAYQLLSSTLTFTVFFFFSILRNVRSPSNNCQLELTLSALWVRRAERNKQGYQGKRLRSLPLKPPKPK